ncbi:ABC transporter permease [Propionicicella superfundia]|uniref:ABC transporter permease n=1 Tax=Propionicicella superfundia TaxID=348582 RepID=UPI00041A4D5E|nr:ABC transporter permease [Propionicicella superfundia]
MGKYIVRRLLQMIPVLLGTTFIIYMMVFVLPGSPLDGKCGERPCPDAFVKKFEEEFNLDKPVLLRYLLYLGNLFRGNLGTNFYGNSVLDELRQRFPTTLELALIAVFFIIVVGIGLGVIAGIRKGRFADHLITVTTLILISMPVFVIGGLAQMVFGLKLGWFPVTATDGTFNQLLLPGMVLASLYIAYVARLTRTSLIENLRADYVRTAKAKGLTRGRQVGLHALRNSMIPVVTYIGLSFGGLMGGAIVTERIFNINGIGFFLYRSITQRDGVSVVGTIALIVIVYLFVNLLVDLLYGVLDPRISLD